MFMTCTSNYLNKHLKYSDPNMPTLLSLFTYLACISSQNFQLYNIVVQDRHWYRHQYRHLVSSIHQVLFVISIMLIFFHMAVMN